MIKKQLFLIWASVLLLGACGENKKSSDTTTTSDSNSTVKSEDSSKSDKPVLSTIKVTIKSGPLAGTYEAQCKEGCTSYGIAGEKVFGNQYSEVGKGPKELSSVQLIVDDVTGDKQTKDFTLTVAFGEYLLGKGTAYNINTRNGSEGSGTLDLRYSADKAAVKIEGTSKEGIPLEVVIDANKVVTMKNIVEQ